MKGGRSGFLSAGQLVFEVPGFPYWLVADDALNVANGICHAEFPKAPAVVPAGVIRVAQYAG